MFCEMPPGRFKEDILLLEFEKKQKSGNGGLLEVKEGIRCSLFKVNTPHHQLKNKLASLAVHLCAVHH